MEPKARRELKSLLTTLLERWPELTPIDRPEELINFRRFEHHKDPLGKLDIYTLKSIEQFDDDELPPLVESGALQLTSSAALSAKRPVLEGSIAETRTALQEP